MSSYRLTLTISAQTVQAVARSPAGEMRPSGPFGFGPVSAALPSAEWVRVQDLSKRLAGGEQALSMEELRELGELLFNALFQGKVLAVFNQLYLAIQGDDDALRLELFFLDETLAAALPWEFLSVPAKYQVDGCEPFLSVSGKVAFVRCTPFTRTPKEVELRPGEKLRIGLASAKPVVWTGRSPLGVVDDSAVLQTLAALEQEVDMGYRLERVFLSGPATPDSLSQFIQEDKPHILHLICHGDVVNDEPLLYLVSAASATLNDAQFYSEQAMRAADVCGLFETYTPGVVILHSCNTGKAAGNARAHSSLAAQLAQAGVPLVVAMQYEIQISTAGIFAAVLYRSLATGETLERAVNAARLAVYHKSLEDGDLRGFGTPQIYANVERSQIFPRTLEGVVASLLALQGMEKIDPALARQAYEASLRGATLALPNPDARGLDQIAAHLYSAIPVPSMGRSPVLLAVFARTLAAAQPLGSLLAQRLDDWLTQNAAALHIDPAKLAALGRDLNVERPRLQLILLSHPNNPNVDKNKKYLLRARDGRRNQDISQGKEWRTLEDMGAYLYMVINGFFASLGPDEKRTFENRLWVEVFLNKDDLSLEIEQVQARPLLGKGYVLGQRFYVVVRSSERWQSLDELNNVWSPKWEICEETLSNPAYKAPAAILADPTGQGSRVVEEQELEDKIREVSQKVVCLGLPFQPSGTLMDNLLISGVPVMVWVRPGAPADALEALLQNLLDDLPTMPARIRAERNKPGALSNALVLLWDDPEQGPDQSAFSDPGVSV